MAQRLEGMISRITRSKGWQINSRIWLGPKHWRRLGGIGAIALLCSGTLAACTNSKAAQCNTLSTAVNKVRPISEQVQQEGKSFTTQATQARNDLKAYKTAAAVSANSFNAAVGQFNTVIQDIQAVNLSDETLNGLKQRYVQNATAISTALKETSAALEIISRVDSTPKGLKDSQQAVGQLAKVSTQMKTLTQEESRIVADFNAYCSAK
jgi:phosphoenolpyruvate-protein kinase (PTS system EI component)